MLAGIYVAAQMLADIGSLKIAVVAGLAVDAGTFIYPITFTVRDLIHKRLGKSAARTTIVLAAGINLVMAGIPVAGQRPARGCRLGGLGRRERHRERRLLPGAGPGLDHRPGEHRRGGSQRTDRYRGLPPVDGAGHRALPVEPRPGIQRRQRPGGQPDLLLAGLRLGPRPARRPGLGDLLVQRGREGRRDPGLPAGDLSGPRRPDVVGTFGNEALRASSTSSRMPGCEDGWQS
ncbi:MAG: VUT family protein [Desulfobacterales bacterium]|nr:VUT family protein [Desulfobacterales bacterium]